MKNKSYVALLEHDLGTGKYGVVVPDVPGFSTVGDSYDDALRNAAEGLLSHIEVMEEYGERAAPPRTIEKIRAEWPHWESWRGETGGELVADIPIPRAQRNTGAYLRRPQRTFNKDARELCVAEPAQPYA